MNGNSSPFQGSGDGTATATAAMAAPLFTAEFNNSLVINYNCNLDRRPAFNYHLLCQFETAASSSFQARWMRVLVKVSVTLTVFSHTGQPRAFHFPKREFGKKSAVRRSFQTAWFDKWPWLHYREENDSVSCYTCLKAKLE